MSPKPKKKILEDWSKNRQISMGDEAVLPEVRRKLAQIKHVDVIIGAQERKNADEVREYLKSLRIKLRPGGTDYYFFGTITAKQADQIDRENKKTNKNRMIDKVWLDKVIRALVEKSMTSVNAPAAYHLFGKGEEDVHWAVLDTGIFAGHKWLKEKIVPPPSNYTASPIGDRVGHGTHVAGIIAKIAPGVKLHDYKVLDDSGAGSSSSIIQAMYDIRKMNFEQRKMVIHGVNLSLGGPVEVGSFGCGASPECQEANRLMLSGVVVCVAAGNDGHKTLATVGSGGSVALFQTFMDVGISDPGNAEEVITVGSVHSLNPHFYGISFFSSKGPTGDGRCKPDVVAPGEKIASASINGPEKTIVMSGTSMATPHVSGVIALFLSAKPEFIGHAIEVKKILMASCTDLKRDRNFQGTGLVDVLRMIQSV
jgi:subtilisin family serine protease